ncbi:MAG TPA: NAD(P)H-quinone oxidoreductase [Vicinamibacterales bacterium]|nr:NAD(P)H-quinone oxidoreductase [Vicinamibacterales bacterium]
MKCVEIAEFGGPEVLRLVDRPEPAPGPGQVLIDVVAAGVNRPDLMQREGKYPPPKGASDLPGLEVAGRIAALGPADEGGTPRSASGRIWRVGDEVCALVSGGGYAQRCVAPGVQCLPLPHGLSIVEAAAVPETYFTVWTNVFERGRLASGEWLLVHGGTSGIGTTAIQIAVARGARVIATAGSADKCRACLSLGAAHAVNYRTADFVAAVKDATGGRGIDVILDIIGGAYTVKNLDCLARDGRLVQIGLMGGAEAAISLRPILLKRLTITGSTLRIRTPAEKGAIALSLERGVWPLFEAGRVKPIVAATFPLSQAAEAHRALESGSIIGKVVLKTI